MKKWLADMPTTALVTVTGCLLSLLTALFYFVAELKNNDLDDTTFGLWLAFLAGMLGFGYASFAKKRDTYMPSPPASPDVEDAKASGASGEGFSTEIGDRAIAEFRRTRQPTVVTVRPYDNRDGDLAPPLEQRPTPYPGRDD